MNKAMKTISALALVTALSLGLSSTATAFPDGHGDNHHRFERMADHLNLNDEQRQQFKQIHRQTRPAILELKDAMQDNREALRKLSPESSGYDKRLAELAGQQGDLVTQKIIQRSQLKAKVFAVLTPEQRQKAKNMKRNHFEKHGRDGGRHCRMGS